MTLTLLGLVISILGPGTWSLDHVTKLEPTSSGERPVDPLAAGGGGALPLLAGFWRPERKPAPAPDPGPPTS